MKELYIKQKLLSLSGRFTVKDADERDVYIVEGSFMKIPKVYTIKDEREAEVARITKRVLTWMPKFTVAVAGEEVITIKKEFSFFKPRYTIDALGLEVTGDWWGMDFEVYQHGEFIGDVKKKWFTWGDSYQVRVNDESQENLIISLVVAIDCVKADQSAAATSAGS
ncbi:LURP-one-related/scramblase family protein [Oceanobacillus alkalisoli]|uniref:LURP-one-related/scramblase family protein n=1 Tax=Oceanobacillus alkalisoli TaxID=2925113 RepID=UPI001EE41DE9|nr:LURP-one-related family protein [Oceanobacillus alkalisoli]MCG5103147.1 LURP-one-related family protein [Oceanobacillus alkalisoli]